VGIPGELVDLHLQGLDVLLVLIRRQGQGQVELVEQCNAGTRARWKLGAAGAGAVVLRCGLAQPGADGMEQGLSDGQIAVAAILRLDQVPGRDTPIGVQDDALGQALE